MKKMMVLTLALSVMMVGNAMAMSGAEANDRGPGRVKIDVNFGERKPLPYAEMIHMALCPECRAHIAFGCDACCHPKPHHLKMHKAHHRGDGKCYGNHRHNAKDRGHNRDGRGNNDRGKGRGNSHNEGRHNGRR